MGTNIHDDDINVYLALLAAEYFAAGKTDAKFILGVKIIAESTVGWKSMAGFALPHLAAVTCHLISILGFPRPPLQTVAARPSLAL
jgi:hypothetical protein